MFVTETLDVLILMHLSWLFLVFSLSLVPYNSGELLLRSLALSSPPHSLLPCPTALFDLRPKTSFSCANIMKPRAVSSLHTEINS